MSWTADRSTPFTTRPDIRGTFGVVTSTHWIASAVGMSVLEAGGNAFDAAVATGFTLQVVEPHLNGPGGDLPVILDSVESGPAVICAQGPAPAAATIEHYRSLGIELIPGNGLLSTVVPGAFDGWLTLLRDHGTISLRAALMHAIGYARDGHPILPHVVATIDGQAEYFAREWPSSASVWTPDGTVPEPHAIFRNPDLAATYARLVEIGEAAGDDRVAQIDAARDAWATGFVADAIFDYLESAEVHDLTGQKNMGVLAPADMATWRATEEKTVQRDYHGWTVHKTGPWGQGPVLLQSLAILEQVDLGAMDPLGAEFVHTVVEAMKLSYADRETYYGDPDHAEIPLAHLLSADYAAERAALIEPEASHEQRPGRVPGFEHQADAYIARAARSFDVGEVGAQEPTMAHLSTKEGDTVHLDVIDRWGNACTATPSGGWLQSNPVVPGLGFPLNSRAQMFWLEEGLPTSLAPGRRPRTTLTPTLAKRGDETLVFGTPGGDQQDQWSLIWFLRYVHHGMGMQEGIDAPLFHTLHFQGSFYPRKVQTAKVMVEPGLTDGAVDDLRARGHDITVADPWTIGRLTAAHRGADGRLTAAATPRLMQAYAVGR